MSTQEKTFNQTIESISALIRDRHRIEFKEPLSVAPSESWPRSWIKEARVVRGVLMLTIKTERDMFKTVATACPEHLITILHKHLSA